MSDLLKIPARRTGLPAGRLSLLMALTLLLLFYGA
jgi:uncharacterized protein (DUF3820 family)